jgi:hypothetical protein
VVIGFLKKLVLKHIANRWWKLLNIPQVLVAVGKYVNEGKQGGMGDGKEELCDIAKDKFLFFREPRPHEVRKNALVERQEGVIHDLEGYWEKVRIEEDKRGEIEKEG